MKKLITLLLAIVMVMMCVACGTEGNENTGTVTVSTEAPEEALSHAEYLAAENGSRVIVEAYVQATQSWWNKDKRGAVTVYAQDEDGGYLIYEMTCSEANAAKLLPGTKIRVTGTKSEWHGLVEIIGGSFEILPGESYIAQAIDVTDLLGTEQLIAHQNELIAVKGLTVEASQDAQGNEVAFLYGEDGTGKEGSDLYLKASVNNATYTFVVESTLRGSESEVYKLVQSLQVGDQIDIEAFLYWSDGALPHISSVSKAG